MTAPAATHVDPGPPAVSGLDLGLFELPPPDEPIGLPAARESVPRPSDLPAARESIPHPAGLPAARESVPRPSDLPAARESIPHPAGLPAARESVPRPSDLPAARESIPHPAGLPAARESVPRPSDLPAARESIPHPAGLPAARESIPRPAGLPAARESIPRPAGLPASRDQIPRPGDLPAPRSEVPIPGGPVRIGRLGTTPKPELLPHHNPGTTQSPLEPLDLGLDLDGAAGAPVELAADPSAIALPGSTIYGVGPSPGVFDPGEPGFDGGLIGGPGDSDLGFTLSIEDASGYSEGAGQTVRPQSVLPAIEVSAVGVLEDSVPLLQPHQQTQRPVAPEPARARSRKPLVAIAVAAVLGLGAGAYFLVLAPSPEVQQAGEILGAEEQAIARDFYAAYELGAQALLDAAGAGGAGADALRARAAELLLLARLGRDGREELVKQAEAALAPIVSAAEPPLAERRARALAEIAANRPQRVDTILAGVESAPGAALVMGLRHLRAGNAVGAAQSLQQAAKEKEHAILARYLLGRAFEGIGEPGKAGEEYAAVVAQNPDHLGALLGGVRVGEKDPLARREKAEALFERRQDASSLAERAAVFVFSGHAARQLGRLPEATRAFQQALAIDGKNVAANLALGESYLREGRYREALARYQSLGPLAHQSAEGKFGLGGAMIATQNSVDGLAVVEAAAQSWPKDPRGPFFRGWAAEVGNPASVAEAMKQYRLALELDPAFVDASLRLASLLQRQKQVQDALAVLKAAEQAGAPPTVLQIAWGDALIVAGQAQRAEDVFRKALAGDAKLLAARLGLAESLRAQGRLGEAKMELEETLVQEPQGEGLREKLAAISLQLGEKEEALRYYQAAIEAGKAAATTHVDLARVAMDLGKLELAEQHLTKIGEESPATPGALYTLGQLRELQGNLGLALQEYRRGTQFENTPQLHLALGKALLKGGREDDALTSLRQAEVLAEARLELGRILLRRSSIERALTDLTAAIAIDPNLDEAYLLIGNAHDHLGDTERAAQAWQSALRVAPGNVEALYRMGRLRMDQGKPREAIDLLRRAAPKVPADKAWAADVFFQLGYAELNAGSKSAARAALQRHLELAPADSPARPAIEKLVEELPR